ncbi:MAG TPA: DUF5615 family PIN-like protein [Rubrobacteraceae bacterium]|nr:DUF5615 family PIN-like protein [Rubrobacteraceae bacterium]
MRLLLDENVDRRLKRFFGEEHEVLTVADRGWKGKRNGELLNLAQRDFDVLLTTDRNIPYQQNISRLDLAVVILEVKRNTLEDLTPLMERVNTSLAETNPGNVIRISLSGE